MSILLLSIGLGQIAFEDATYASGIEQWGDTESLQIAWIDFNQDGLPDLWIGKHNDRFRSPSLYINQNNGTFIDIGKDIYPENPVNDTHGSAWVDFDNDGDLDLFESVGGYGGTGVGPNHFFVNENVTLINRAMELGVDNPLGRGRMPLWFDYDRDGWLDLILLNLVADRLDHQEAENLLFKQNQGSFINVTNETGMIVDQAFAFFSDLTGDRIYELASGNLSKIYDVSRVPFTEIRGIFENQGNVRDISLADINNDLRIDIFALRTHNNNQSSDLFQPTSDMLAARLTKSGESFSFQTEGALRVDLFQGVDLNASEIVLGEGLRGSEQYRPEKIPFFVTPSDERVVGLPTCTNSEGSYLAAGYRPESHTWNWQLCGDANINLTIETEPTNQIHNVHSDNINGLDQARKDLLLVFDPQTQSYVDKLETRA